MRKGSKMKLATLALAGLGVAMSSGAYAEGMKVSSQGGIKAMNAAADPYWFKLGGLLQLDQVFVHGKNNQDQGFPNNANLRRARLITEGGLGCHWSYWFGLELEGPAVAWKNAYISYKGFENSTISIGQISAPVSLSNWAGTADILTLERPAIANVFTPADGLGIYADHQMDMLTFAAAVWQPGDGVAASSNSAAPGSDLLGAAARITFSPIHTPDYVWHFGVSSAYQDLHNKDNTLATSTNPFSTRPEIRGRSVWPKLVTQNILNPNNTIKYWTTAGVEAAGLWGPLTVQAEYIGAHLSRIAGNSNESFKGWYANAAYVLTGESKHYDFASGTFGTVSPAATSGALEVFAQYSYISLRDHNLGSIEHDASAGLNWYINKTLRATAEYSRANLGIEPKRRLDLVGLRLQAKWS